MRFILLLSLLLILNSNNSLVAQERFHCGVKHEHEEIIFNRLELIKAHLKEHPRAKNNTNDIINVPITFHLIAKTNGSNRINERFILEELCEINEFYLPVGIQFFIKNSEFNYVNNDVIYDRHWEATEGLMEIIRDGSSLNVFVLNTVDPEDSGIKGYFTPFFDWVVVNKTSIAQDNNVLAHELGHFFSLNHPYTGWDSGDGGYNPATDGIPAPAKDRLGRETELMDKSNCEISGDRICDTPPDYFDGRTNSCAYIGNARDPNNTPIDTDKSNLMSNFFSCAEYHFSEKQIEIIRANFDSDISFGLETRSRNFLRANSNSIVPAVIEEQPQLVIPANNTIVSNESSIRLEWTNPPNATHFILDIGLVPTFSVRPQRYIVKGNTFDLDGNLVDLGRKYFWRVTPFNAYSTCASATSTKSFTIGQTTSVSDIPELESIEVLPNPAPANQQFQLLAQVSESFEAQANLFNTNGQLVKSLGQYNFVQGSNSFDIPTSQLSPGIYTLSLRSQKGVSVKRIVIF